MTYFENNDCDWSVMTSYVIINTAQMIMVLDVELISRMAHPMAPSKKKRPANLQQLEKGIAAATLTMSFYSSV